MQKKVILITAIIATGVIILLLIPKEDSEIVWENSEKLNLQSRIDYIEECHNILDVPIEERPANLRYCAEGNIPSIEDTEKLRLINGTQILPICEVTSREFRQPGECSFENEISEPCSIIFTARYKYLTVRPNTFELSIAECGDNHYYQATDWGYAGPPGIRLYQIRLSEEKASQLKD